MKSPCGIREAESKREQPRPQPVESGSCSDDEIHGSPTLEKPTEDKASSAALPKPCKVITHLAENPSTNVTQMPVKADGETDCSNPDRVECSKAYRMLMQYATSEEKLDTISRALEEGCVANKGSGGGYRV